MIVKNLSDKNISKDELINSVDTSHYIIKEVWEPLYGKEHILYFIRMKCDNLTIKWSASIFFLWHFAEYKMGLSEICTIEDYKELHNQ